MYIQCTCISRTNTPAGSVLHCPANVTNGKVEASITGVLACLCCHLRTTQVQGPFPANSHIHVRSLCLTELDVGTRRTILSTDLSQWRSFLNRAMVAIILQTWFLMSGNTAGQKA